MDLSADLAEVAGGTTPRQCRPTGGRVEVCNAAYGRNGWLGIAQIWVAGSHIVQGVTKLNDSYPMRAAEKQYVMCQEIGHTFGLGHQDENHDNPNLGSCMDYSRYPEGGVHVVGGASINYGPSNESPNSDTAAGGTGTQHGDFEQLLAIYGHTDSTTTVGPLAAGSGRGRSGTADDEGPNNPAEFGRPVGPKDGYGRDILFVTDLPDGRKRFTHVHWALPERPGARP